MKSEFIERIYIALSFKKLIIIVTEFCSTYENVITLSSNKMYYEIFKIFFIKVQVTCKRIPVCYNIMLAEVMSRLVRQPRGIYQDLVTSRIIFAKQDIRQDETVYMTSRRIG